jgi:hypothetical protein
VAAWLVRMRVLTRGSRFSLAGLLMVAPAFFGKSGGP